MTKTIEIPFYVGPYAVHCGNCGWAKTYSVLPFAKRAISQHKRNNETCRKDSSIQIWDSQGQPVVSR